MAKEGFVKNFMQKKPLLYCTLILALIGVVCGALLGLGNKFLYTEPDNSGTLGVIFSALTGTKEHQTIFDKNTPDSFTVGTETVTIKKAARDAAKVDAAYRIDNGGKTYLLLAASGQGRNGAVKAVTAYEVNPDGDAANDKIAGARPYEAPSAEYKNANNKTFWNSFADKTSGTNVKLSDTDGYTGATVTAGGLVQAVNNASAFYKLHRGSLLGQAEAPFLKALKMAYKFAAGAAETPWGDIDTTGAPNIALYMTDDGLPVFDIAADGYNIVLSFADKHGYLGGAAVYGGGAAGALIEAAGKAAGKNPKDAGFAADIGDGSLAAFIKTAYEFFDDNREEILKKNAAYDDALIEGLDITAQAAAAGTYTFRPVLGEAVGRNGGNLYTVKFGNASYYSLYEISNGDYIALTFSGRGYSGDVLGMTYISGADNTMEEFRLHKRTSEIGYPHYLDTDFFLDSSYRGMLGEIRADNYKYFESGDTTNAENPRENPNTGGSVTIPSHTRPNVNVTKSYDAIAECLVNAANIYRAFAEIA